MLLLTILFISWTKDKLSLKNAYARWVKISGVDFNSE